MEAKNTKYCKTCKGTQWHNDSLCFACEVTISQAKAIVLERARTGLSTPTDALAAIEAFEARPKCFEAYEAPRATLRELEKIQRRSLSTQARQLGVAV
tara:strand:- start:963 stop:1256 length:294 start_codon:yes stop_codon:yes gene_type:complete